MLCEISQIEKDKYVYSQVESRQNMMSIKWGPFGKGKLWEEGG
jgi:hypothetical protein